MKSLLCLILLTVCCYGQIWIAPGPPNTSGTGKVFGSGTQLNPFRGDFDVIWASNSIPGRAIVLTAGTFWSRSINRLFYDYEHLTGAGRAITVIKRDPAFPPLVDTTIVGGYCNHVCVRGITVDCNADSNSPVCLNGIVLIGTNNLIADCEVINATSGTNGNECFPIFMSDNNVFLPTDHNLITGCEVSQIWGNYVTAIAMTGNGDITLCNVIFPDQTTVWPPTFHAYGGGNLSFCECHGGSAGWYFDGPWVTNKSCVNNRFYNVYTGVDIALANTGIDGCHISGNVIELNPYSTNNNASGGMRLWGAAALANLIVSDNLIRGQAADRGLYVLGTNTVNLKIVNNTFSKGMTVLLGQTNVVYCGNTDTTGAEMLYQSLQIP